MRPSRRHHFVSRFYLRNFVVDKTNPKLFVVDIEARKCFTTSTDNVALETDFHTVAEHDEPDIVEKRLSQLESDIAPALSRIIEREHVGHDDDAQLVLFFIALLLVKNPAMRETMNNVTDTLMKIMSQQRAIDPTAWKKHIDELIEEGVYEPDIDVESLRQTILNEDFTIGLSPGAHMQTEFPIAEKLMPLLLERRWNILRAKEGQFITCDRPAVLMWADPRENAAIGLRLANTRLLFPMTPQHALLGGFELEDAIVDIDADGVACVNGRIILNARRQVYARDEAFEYLLEHSGGRQPGADLVKDDLNARSDET